MQQRREHRIYQPVSALIVDLELVRSSCPDIILYVNVPKSTENTKQLSRSLRGPVLQPNTKAIVGRRMEEPTSRPLSNRINRTIRKNTNSTRQLHQKNRVQADLWIL